MEEESGDPVVEKGKGEAQEEDVVEGVVDGVHGQGAEGIQVSSAEDRGQPLGEGAEVRTQEGVGRVD